MSKKMIIVLLFVMTQFLFSSTTFAEYNSGKLGEAIGGYLIANDLLDKLSESKCGYAVKKNDSFNAAMEEVMPYLNGRDKKMFRSFIASNEFKRELEENNEFINGYLHAANKDGLDEKTICGMILSNIAMTYQIAQQQWDYAKQNYSK